MTRTISVITPTHDRPGKLTEALDSVAGQTGLPTGSVEAIVVNDGECDITAPVAHARRQGLTVQQHAHPQCRGLSAARNTGLTHARGRYVSFLDDDDVFLPQHLACATTALQQHAVDVVYTAAMMTSERVDPACPHGRGEQWSLPYSPGLLEVTNLLPVHTAVLRRRALGDAQFDESLPALEDWDFWLRLAHQGARFAHHDEITVVYHREAAPSMVNTLARQAPAMGEVSQLVRRLWTRWPASDPRAARWRLYSGIMHWQVLDALVTRRAVHPSYYLRTLRALAAAWHGHHDETTLVAALEHAIQPDGEVQRVAA